MSEISPSSERHANDSAASGHLWEIFDFDMCRGNESGSYAWAVCTTLSFAFGFPATIAILWEIFKTYRRGTPFTANDFFILNLSIMDGIFLASAPTGLLNHFIFYSQIVEALWNGLYAFNACGRPLMMACACVDCYLAVVHPITYHKRKSLTPRIVSAVIVWALTLANVVVFLFSFRYFYSMIVTVPILTALAVIVFCDSFIVYTLLKSDPGRKNIHPQKQRAIQTLVNSLVMALLSYLPLVLLVVVGRTLITDEVVFMCNVGIPVTISSTLGSTVLPLLHLNNQRKLACVRIGCCWKL